MIFISYHTTGVYKKVMNDFLLPSLKKWDLKYDIQEIEDRGSWQLNTGIKCEFIKSMLLKHKEDVCFIDADGTIEQYPELLFNIPQDYDIAMHLLHWKKFWRGIRGDKQRELLSGTMVIKYNNKTLKLLDEWSRQVKIQKSVKEQKVLENILLNNSQYKFYDLPACYCAIKKFDGSVPEYIGEPIILHHQVSREHKYKNKGKQ